MWRALLFFSAISLAGALAGAEALTARDGWIRPAPPVAPVRAGYVTIENGSDAEVVFDKAESPQFGAVEIHTMFDDGGVMRMRRLTELRVPAKGKVELKPGGMHLMLFRPKAPLAEHAQVEVRLSGVATSLQISLDVKGEAR